MYFTDPIKVRLLTMETIITKGVPMDLAPPDVNSQNSELYRSVLNTINDAGVPYLIGGGLAFQHYTTYPRAFNDLDLFCKAGDYPKILKVLEKNDFSTSVQDEKWLAKAKLDDVQIDILFSTPNNVQTVDDTWFTNGTDGKLFNVNVTFIGREELVWTKIYVQDANKYDGPDVHHLILKLGDILDWKGLLGRMEADWEILLAAIINFRFVFPSKRTKVPGWLMEELLERLHRQIDMPIPIDEICRGPLLSRTNYAAAIKEEGFIV